MVRRSLYHIIITLYIFITVCNSGHWLVPDITGESPPPCSSFTMTSMYNNRALIFGGDTPDGRDNTLYIAQCTKHAVVSIINANLSIFK